LADLPDMAVWAADATDNFNQINSQMAGGYPFPK
jgi:hypothetical protein